MGMIPLAAPTLQEPKVSPPKPQTPNHPHCVTSEVPAKHGKPFPAKHGKTLSA